MNCGIYKRTCMHSLVINGTPMCTYILYNIVLEHKRSGAFDRKTI